MAKALAYAFYHSDYKNVTILSRNRRTGIELAERYQFDWKDEIRNEKFDFIVNATPIGMNQLKSEVSTDLPLPKETIQNARLIMDVVINPLGTPLILYSEQMEKRTIDGFEITILQAVEQFRLYTGVQPDFKLVKEATAFAKA